MKNKLLLLLKSALFLLILGICLLLVMNVVRRKESNYKYADFFDLADKKQIDVLFMGSSHVINGVNPVTLYSNYGYTSYNMGGHGSVLQATYWELIEALDYCTPKWVVVDTYMLEKDYQYLDRMGENATDNERRTSVDQLHLNMDAWPLRKLKIAAINDLIKDRDNKNQFLFDFIVYHDRWKELEEDDFQILTKDESRNELYGAEMRYDVELSPLYYPDPDPGQCLDSHTVGQEYLMKIIDECQRRGIGVLVTYLPFCATYEDKMAANSAAEIAVRYAVPYLNMLNAGIVDYDTDLNDPGHLNVSGSMKVTNYIGAWLAVNGDLEDHRGDPSYSEWYDKSLNFYADYRNRISSDVDLYRVLDILSLDEVGYVVYFNQGSGAFIDDKIKHFIGKMSGTETIYSARGPYILISDALTGRKYEACDGGSINGAATTMGTMVYQPVEEKFRFLYALEAPDMNYLYDENYLNYDIQILAFEKETGELLGHSYYRSFGGNYRMD